MNCPPLFSVPLDVFNDFFCPLILLNTAACMCVCVFPLFPSQGVTRHDALDQITATRRERHQHHHSWLCGAGRIHQCRHHAQLSHGWRRWRWCHLRAYRGRRRAWPPSLLPVAGSVFSLFCWHLFQKGGAFSAPFTFFRAIERSDENRSSGVWVGVIRERDSAWF